MISILSSCLSELLCAPVFLSGQQFTTPSVSLLLISRPPTHPSAQPLFPALSLCPVLPPRAPEDARLR